MQGNAWIYYNLYDARQCAREYTKKLKKASSVYAEIAKLIEGPPCMADVAPMARMPKDGKTWIQQMRKQQAVIRRIYSLVVVLMAS